MGGHRFRMAEEEIASRTKVAAQAPDHLLLHLAFEIDEDVAAEYDVHVGFDRIARIHQVEPGKTEAGAQLRHDPYVAARAIARGHEVARPPCRRDRLRHLGGENAAPRLGEYLGRDV